MLIVAGFHIYTARFSDSRLRLRKRYPIPVGGADHNRGHTHSTKWNVEQEAHRMHSASTSN